MTIRRMGADTMSPISAGDPIRIVNISIQAEGADSMKEAAEALKDKGLEFEISDYDYRSLENDPLLLNGLKQSILEADFIIIRCMAEPYRFKKYAECEPLLGCCNGDVLLFSLSADMREACRPVFTGDDEDYALLCSYLTFKGIDNERGLLVWIANRLGASLDQPDPVIPRMDGIHHPDCDPGISFEEYLPRLDPSRPTAGLFMTETDVQSGNTTHIDSLIRALEDKGLNVIPVFQSHLSIEDEGEHVIPRCIRKYMMDGDRSRIDVLVMTTSSSNLLHSKKGAEDGFTVDDTRNFYKTLADVAVIQALSVHGRWEDFEAEASGLDKHDISILVIRPELDGQILGVPFGRILDGDGKKLTPIPAGVDHDARLASNWAELHRKRPCERRLAIIMYQPRDDSSCIGASGGLDVPESVVRMLGRMKAAGYDVDHVPESGDALIQELLCSVTNDLNWRSDEEIREKAAGIQSDRDYRRVFDSIPVFNQNRLIEHWGDPPGKVTVSRDGIVIPGIVNGNILITYQPIRAWGEQTEAIYHDPVVPAPHQYLGFYRWLKDEFHADAVYHMGTHGSMEWLPGKSVGLSEKCDPDMILNALPDIYPFCIDDPGEGIQAKRRVEAVLIGYLNPSMMRAGSYEDLDRLETLLREYFLLKDTPNAERRGVLVRELYDEVKGLDLFEDLQIPADTKPEDFENRILDVHSYVSDFKDALIPDGLHVLGDVPEGIRLDETVYSVMRLRNGDVPSMRTAFAKMRGIDADDCIADPSGITEVGELKSDALDRVDAELMELLRGIRGLGYDPKACMEMVHAEYGSDTDLDDVLSFALDDAIPRILRTSDEMQNLLNATSGSYVPPGPSGPPTRGNVRVLPSGRNFYGIDPDSVPTLTAWEIGRRMADQMLQRHLDERGRYPTEIGMVIWATDTMKTNGDDVGYILWLMGVRPVWSRAGDLVTGLEVIPLEELGRPRVDVTLRITGLFRDAYPNLVDMFNDAVDLVADLDETDEENSIRANVRRDVTEALASGIPEDQANIDARLRVFGSPPGSYGGGVDLAIATSAWKDTKDLADVCSTWSSYAYGHGYYGAPKREYFAKRFSKVSATIKNMPDREHDILAMDEVFEYMGGLNAFCRAYGDKDAMFLIGDDSDPDSSKLRSAKEECRFIFRSKVLNPKWLEGIKVHGYRGAHELSKLAEYMIGWDGTSDAIDDWMYERFTEKFIMDGETRQWLEEKNPYALMEMLNRMHEAIERGLWDASDDMKERLREIFMEVEGTIEEKNDGL